MSQTIEKSKNQKRALISGRALIFIFGLLVTAFYFVAIAGLFLFLNQLLPWMNQGVLSSRQWIVNLSLLTLFTLPHSLLLEKGPRKWVAKIFPAKIFMSVYSFHATSTLILMYFFWNSSSAMVWNFHFGPGQVIVIFFMLLSWLFMGVSLHFSGLFHHAGIAQWTSYVFKKNYEKIKPFQGPYRYMRHPILISFFLMIWIRPSMSLDQLILSVYWSVYLYVGMLLKEKRLQKSKLFQEYKKEVSMIPFYNEISKVFPLKWKVEERL
ncbi:NnrU family protein [Halobacteriovorax sp. GB3]|uniref:NnrU family protein n=1 Tax=Halobacteriovorax sp. GB3 TaxID=2719615 RepID=UPI00235F335F|nr:NnrU family protein [Halobacteriovorax sp. GB3]MDD0852932.1 NnrU family protein [Halobacteriovorax sp. GB3]